VTLNRALLDAVVSALTVMLPARAPARAPPRQFFRADPSKPFVRHDLRLWESAVNRGPRLRDESGAVLLGDAVVADWKKRTTRATARVRAYYDIHPDKSSELTLDATKKNGYGDALPRIVHRPDAASVARHDATVAHVRGVFERLARNGNATMRPLNFGTYVDHPAGGCRMGTDAATSVTDSFGRTHDHENLFVVGSPTLPTAGCTNGTLTFAAGVTTQTITVPVSGDTTQEGHETFVVNLSNATGETISDK